MVSRPLGTETTALIFDFFSSVLIETCFQESLWSHYLCSKQIVLSIENYGSPQGLKKKKNKTEIKNCNAKTRKKKQKKNKNKNKKNLKAKFSKTKN